MDFETTGTADSKLLWLYCGKYLIICFMTSQGESDDDLPSAVVGTILLMILHFDSLTYGRILILMRV